MDTVKIKNNKYRFIFNDETATIINLLHKELIKEKYVEYVGYENPHPLNSQFILTLQTSDKNPREVLNYTIDNLLKKINDIKASYLTKHLHNFDNVYDC
jgi:DNA-directed RNA polymerase subunit L